MKTASQIIAALGGNQSTGMCRCPAHDDTNPSLHVTEKNGKVLVKCFAGCSQEAVVEALKQRDLWRSQTKRKRVAPMENVAHNRLDDIAGEILDAAAEEPARGPRAYLRGRGIKHVPSSLRLLGSGTMHFITGKTLPAMIAPVNGKNGEIVAVHVTYLTRDAKKNAVGKEGKVRRMHGAVAGGLVILKRADPEKPFIVGEGIETVLSAMQLAGWPGGAALSAGAMKKIPLPEAAEYIIAADNDPAGLRAAAALAARLRLEGRRVRVAVPPSEGTDWNDVLQRNDAKARWQAALDADAGQSAVGPISALEEAKFMDLRFPKRQLLLRPWLPQGSLAMIYAPRGEGKTWFALAVAKAIARGQDLLGWRCRSRKRVLYVEGELPGRSVQWRLGKFRRSPDGMFHILCRDTYLLRRETMPDLGETEGRLELNRIIDQCQPDVIIIDTISTMVRSGVENDAEVMGADSAVASRSTLPAPDRHLDAPRGEVRAAARYL